MNNCKFLIISFLFCLNGFCQTTLKGKIIAEVSNLENVNIINISNKNATVSDALGYFDILAKPQDTIVFSAINIVGIEVVLKQKDFGNKLFFVRLKTKINNLEEVTINNKINAVSLGIIPKGIKRYTPAERRLKNAGDFKPIQLLSILGGTLPVEPIINAITGRTDRLKKELVVENKEKLLLKLNDLLNDEFYTNELNILLEQIKGFQIMAIDNPKIVEAILNNNKTMTSFLLLEFSKSYKTEIISKQ